METPHPPARRLPRRDPDGMEPSPFSTRAQIAGVISLVVNAVLFGAGAVVVLSVPALDARASLLLPLVVIASLLATPFVAWRLAPRLRLSRSGGRSRSGVPRIGSAPWTE